MDLCESLDWVNDHGRLVALAVVLSHPKYPSILAASWIASTCWHSEEQAQKLFNMAVYEQPCLHLDG